MTNLSTKNKMAVVTSYWEGKFNSDMLKMKRCKDATAEGLYSKLIKELFEKVKVKWWDFLLTHVTQCGESTIRWFKD